MAHTSIGSSSRILVDDKEGLDTLVEKDSIRWPSNARGLMHDKSRDTTEMLDVGTVELLLRPDEGDPLLDSDGHPLPRFKIKLNNENTSVALQVRATSRAHWSFDQPTRAGFTSHLTYNEYPLEVESLKIEDENGVRQMNDYRLDQGQCRACLGNPKLKEAIRLNHGWLRFQPRQANQTEDTNNDGKRGDPLDGGANFSKHVREVPAERLHILATYRFLVGKWRR